MPDSTDAAASTSAAPKTCAVEKLSVAETGAVRVYPLFIPRA